MNSFGLEHGRRGGRRFGRGAAVAAALLAATACGPGREADDAEVAEVEVPTAQVAAGEVAEVEVAFEEPPVLRARDVAPAALLAGPGFQVLDAVPTDGLTTRFTIQSDAGVFEADGVETLALRVGEIPAILELDRTRKTETFLQALGATAARPLQAAAQIVQHPVETAKGLPSGVGRFFDRVESGAKRLADAATDPTLPADERTQALAKMGGAAAADALGYEKELRDLAKRLGVDPYTTNPVLADKLHEMAWVAFAGRVGLNTLIAVTVPASVAITGTRMTHDIVYDTPRGDLVVRNEERLHAMGVDEESIRALQRAPGFTLSVQTALVEALGRLPGAAGRPDVVALAATAETHDQALFLERAVAMLAASHAEAPVAQLVARGTVVGRMADGAIVVPAPLDYVAWTERVARFAEREDLAAPRREILLTGRASERARRQLAARGWTVREGQTR